MYKTQSFFKEKDITDLFCDYLDGSLSTEKHRRLAEELCDPCFNAEWQSLLDLYKALQELCKDIGDEPVPRRLLPIIVQLALAKSLDG